MTQIDTVAKPPQSRIASYIKRYRGLVMKVSSALTDQAVFAGSNFTINILLARWMSPNEYGAFVLAYAWWILVHNFYEAILVEPMSYYASDKYSSKFHKYMGYIFFGHTSVGIVMTSVLLLGAVFAYFFDTRLVASAIAGVALAAPFMSIRWLARQPLYVQSRPQYAVIGGLVYLFIALPGLVLLHETGNQTFSVTLPGLTIMHETSNLSPFTILILMGFAGITASLVLFLGLVKPDWNLKDETINARLLIADHWSYGKWSVSYRALQWLQANIYYVVMPMIVSLSATGALRSMNNLVQPIWMANAAISSVLLPMFVREYNKDKFRFVRRVRSTMLFFILFVGSYFVFLVIFGQRIISLLYNGQYDEFIDFPIIFTLAMVPLITIINLVLNTALRAMGWVKLAFQSKILPTVLNLTVGMYLLYSLGILGANLAVLLNSFVSLFILSWFFIKQLRSDERSPLTKMQYEHATNEAETQADVETETTDEVAETAPSPIEE